MPFVGTFDTHCSCGTSKVFGRSASLEADHTTVWCWVQRHGPELERRLRRHLKPTNKSWRVDEAYVRVKGRWCYLYRAIDSAGATIDFLLSAKRDAGAAKRLFRKALRDRSHLQPCVMNTDLEPFYTSAIPAIKKEGTLRRCRWHRPVQYLNDIGGTPTKTGAYAVSLMVIDAAGMSVVTSVTLNRTAFRLASSKSINCPSDAGHPKIDYQPPCSLCIPPNIINVITQEAHIVLIPFGILR